MTGTAYVAPAARVLTVLHRPAPDGTQTACALPYDEGGLWMPVEYREGDVICWVCEAESGAQGAAEDAAGVLF